MRCGSDAGRVAGEKTGSLKKQGFYQKSAWRKARRLALQRDRFLCQACLRAGRITPATEVHHKKELEACPELGLELSNLESLCWPCHEATKRRGTRSVAAPARVIRITDRSDDA